MGQINATVDIDAAPDKVWETIVNPTTYGDWLTIHTKWKGEVPERFTQGSTMPEVVTMLGMPNTITWTVDELDEGSRLRISGTGMAGVKTSFEFRIVSDGNGGTTASIDAEFSGSMIVGALGKAVEKDGEKNLKESLARLGALVG